MEADILLHAILAPLLLAAALLCVPLAVRFAFDRASRPEGGGAPARASIVHERLAPAAFALVPLAAYAHQQGISSPSACCMLLAKPTTAFDRFPLAVLVALTIAFVLDRTARACGAVGSLAVAAFGAAASCVVLQSPGHLSAEWRLALACIVALAAFGSSASARGTTRATFVAWWGTFAAASGTCLLAGFAKLAVVMGAASAAAALGAVLCGALPWVRADGGTGTLFAVILGAGTFLGLGYDERGLPLACWAAVAVAPASALAASAFLGRPRLASALRAGLPIAVAGAAVALAAAMTSSVAPDASGY